MKRITIKNLTFAKFHRIIWQFSNDLFCEFPENFRTGSVSTALSHLQCGRSLSRCRFQTSGLVSELLPRQHVHDGSRLMRSCGQFIAEKPHSVTIWERGRQPEVALTSALNLICDDYKGSGESYGWLVSKASSRAQTLCSADTYTCIVTRKLPVGLYGNVVFGCHAGHQE